jgi:phosphoglycerol transferase MdoB-like AlkP superfamily enzyme
MFASMACFPNIPGYSALMQTPEGDTKFSGILDMLNQRDYQSMYIYNGDFAWDNQNGFFGGQGMQRFIGRYDFINPKVSDPTWGVSDEDMFNRAAEELAKQPTDKPFFAFLQTLSNHTPYALPEQLPVDAVTDMGGLNEHLTAMRYADWALGEFFNKIEKMDFYQNTLFVLVGDHGFGTNEQLTDIDILRFHVPLLIIGPNVTEQNGFQNNTVGSQVDIAPTIAGLLGGPFIHSCWGRDLLNVEDAGFAMIKQSGSDVTTALLQGDSILIQDPDVKDKLYKYHLAEENSVQPLDDKAKHDDMKLKINAYIQSAMKALLYGQLGSDYSKE